jgi:hypothetical protein
MKITNSTKQTTQPSSSHQSTHCIAKLRHQMSLRHLSKIYRPRVGSTIYSGTRTNTNTQTLPVQVRFSKRSNSSSSSGKDKDLIKPPPEIAFDHRKGNTILHQKAARAAELHSELNALLESQAKRRAEEANRPFGAGFIEFVKTSKSELINITAAFTCVMLAYQIVNVRKGARRLIEKAEEMNGTVEEYRQILRILSSEAFVQGVEGEYQKEINRNDNGSGSSTGSAGRFGALFGRGRGSADTSSNVGTMEEKDILTKVIQAKLAKIIGDHALTSTEIEEKKLVQLQKEMGLVQQAKKSRLEMNIQSNTDDNSLGGLDQVFYELQKEDGEDSPKTVVKRTQGFI